MNSITEPRIVAPGGQVPLLKHAIMVWLQASEKQGNGRIHGDMYNIAAETKASPSNVTRALYDLQKQGLITLRERKNSGTNGHGATTVLSHFSLTPSGRTWTAEKATLADLHGVGTYSPDQLNPGLVTQAMVEDVATDMGIERIAGLLSEVPETIEQGWVPDNSPVGMLAAYLKSKGGPVHIDEANVALGYAKKSTGIYGLAKSHPEAFRVKSARVEYIADSKWRPTTHPGVGRPKSRVEREMAEREVPTVTHVEPDGETTPKPDLGPELTALLAREVKRSKVAEAVALLEAAGLDEDALSAALRIPDDSPLESEVLALLHALGHGPEEVN